jgi:hypothetical protein
MVTDAPTAPEVGDKLVMLGAAVAKGANKEQNRKTQKSSVLRNNQGIGQTSALLFGASCHGHTTAFKVWRQIKLLIVKSEMVANYFGP